MIQKLLKRLSVPIVMLTTLTGHVYAQESGVLYASSGKQLMLVQDMQKYQLVNLLRDLEKQSF